MNDFRPIIESPDFGDDFIGVSGGFLEDENEGFLISIQFIVCMDGEDIIVTFQLSVYGILDNNKK